MIYDFLLPFTFFVGSFTIGYLLARLTKYRFEELKWVEIACDKS